MADAAERRARTFTWDATARANLATLDAEAATGRHARRLRVGRGAAGAAAVIALAAIVTSARRGS
jgi:hypothetical protein